MMDFLQWLNNAFFDWLCPVGPVGRYIETFYAYENPYDGVSSRHSAAVSYEEAARLRGAMHENGHAEAAIVRGPLRYIPAVGESFKKLPSRTPGDQP